MISNATIFTVSEVSNRLKAAIETQFGYVHVRGELTEVKRAASGHIYATLKDKDAVLNVIIWRTAAERLKTRPEDGLEVIATGRMTTYPGRSNYQLVIEQMEVAGEGALLKLIEERRKKLAAEGLFDESRKRKLPLFPQRIAVVTSPTGAVIRDIMHRLAERYPCRIDLWPVLVQGEGAAAQITAALNAIAKSTDLPDLVIVARGGGSLEDLMAFNDEAVVRAAANCPVPLISAVGHETDTTLIDWVSDKRAPTPTAAAEIATPHRTAIIEALAELENRMQRCLVRREENSEQKLDQVSFRLNAAMQKIVERKASKLAGLRPRSPLQILQHQFQHVQILGTRAQQGIHRRFERQQSLLGALKLRAPAQVLESKINRLAGLKLRPPSQIIEMYKTRLGALENRMKNAGANRLEKAEQKMNSLARLLDASSFEKTLERGFVLVRDEHGHAVTQADALNKGQQIQLQFAAQKTRVAEIT